VHAKDFDMECVPKDERILEVLTVRGGAALYDTKTTSLHGHWAEEEQLAQVQVYGREALHGLSVLTGPNFLTQGRLLQGHEHRQL
jgi:hypothetical protein